MVANYNSLKTKESNTDEILAILNSADIFENVDCDIDGEIKLMNEYRIVVEPNSKEDKILTKIFN